MASKKRKDSPEEEEEEEGKRSCSAAFPDEFLKSILEFVKSHKDRNSVSLVCKVWYEAERLNRTSVFIGNCYSVSPELVVKRFPNIRNVTLKGKPRFSDFNLVPPNWGADIHPWLVAFASAYPSLEELRLKRMTVTDESLEFLAHSFLKFKAISLVSCDGFSTEGIASITTYCRNLTELDIQENSIDDLGGSWLSYFPKNFTSLEVLNFANLQSEVSFDALESLVARCKSLKVLKVNKDITLEQLKSLLVLAPQLMELGTGTFSQELTTEQYAELENVFNNCKNFYALSGLWEATSHFLPALYPACTSLTFLNLSVANLQSVELAKLLEHCPNLRRLWVLDTVEDKGLEAVGSSCPLLEELRVFPADPSDLDVMTNAAVATVVQNCPDFTVFRLCIMNPGQPDYTTNEPMDEAFGSVVRTCTKLTRLSVSGLLTDLAFENIGKYAKNLQFLSMAFVGSSDRGMQHLMAGCPKLRKLEIRDCPFGDAALLSGMERYESMRSLWMSGCSVTMDGCRRLAKEMPKLNVEVIKEEESDDETQAEKYVRISDQMQCTKSRSSP
ncbi:Leucine-rich repeat [Macleaya cordata]|uniref:Leucine-rich repeat n=1 Tax=Macleaya cordata TaxID=56857 RepID=A0A200QC96_MACCD|nr:Leucine-rich repeat [Macleaya cordata]